MRELSNEELESVTGGVSSVGANAAAVKTASGPLLGTIGSPFGLDRFVQSQIGQLNELNIHQQINPAELGS